MAEKLIFKNKTKVQEYAIKLGYDMGTSKLNTTLSNKLNGIPKKDGCWFQADIDNLLNYGNFKKMAGAISNDISELDRRIKEADLREREGKAEQVERKNAKESGQLIDRSKVNMDLVARMIQLRKDEKTDNKVKVSEIITLCKGDIELEKDLLKFMNSATDKRMNTYAKPFKFAVSMSELEKEIALLEEEDA